MSLKNTLTESIANPISRGRATMRTVAKVLVADEHSNRCTVRYLDKNSNVALDKDVMVDLRNAQEWFPNVGDMVIYEIANSTGLITSKYTEDYNGEIRGQKTLDNDRMADGEASVVGGSIM